jgi:hypothetical protein
MRSPSRQTKKIAQILLRDELLRRQSLAFFRAISPAVLVPLPRRQEVIKRCVIHVLW